MRHTSPQMEEVPSESREPDTGTMTEVFHRHAPSLFAYFRQHTASREEAEDLLHEVFAAALEQPQFGLLSDAE
jgi:RNA polymerase sigma-70 factor, ECF subfamily